MGSPSILQSLAQSCRVPVTSITDAYPPTPLQSSMFAAFLSSPSTDPHYVARLVFTLHHNIDSNPNSTVQNRSLDLERFQSAWKTTVQRNEILRTRLVQGPSAKPLLVVLKEPFKCQLNLDISLNEFLEAGETLEADYGRPLSRWSLVEGGKHFVWTISHAIYDGWSLPLILSDFAGAWTSFSHPMGVGLPVEIKHNTRPSPSFKTFVKYLMKERKENSENALSFWRNELKTGEQCVTFPQLKGSDRGYTPMTSAVHSSSVAVSWPSLYHSQQRGIRNSTYLWAAWAILLWKHTHSASVLFGATLNGRDYPVPGIENISGPTTTTVPVVVGIDCEMTVKQFIQQLQEKASSSTEHGWMGMQDILGACGKDVHIGKLNSVLVVQPSSSSGTGNHDEHFVDPIIRPTGWTLNEERSGTIRHNLGICLILTPSDSGLTINLQYDPNLKTRTEISWIVDQFTATLTQLLRAETQNMSLGQIQVSGNKEVQQIERWNSNSISPVDDCLHDLFLARAGVNGDAEALFSEDGTVTYRQLSEFSQNLAKYLLQQDLGPQSMVPIAFENSWLAIVAILAVLRAGACFVPIHPSTPRDRMISILEQTDAKLLICSEDLVAGLKEFEIDGLDLLELSDHTLAVMSSSWSKVNLDFPTVSSAALAYTYFTSGSTGDPKGVCMSHQSSSTGNTAYTKVLSLTPSSRVLQFASLSFDVSILEIFATLISGGCVCIPSPQDRLQHLHSAIQKLRCNVLVLTPTVAKLLQVDYAEHPIPIDTLCLTGEPLTASDVEFWASKTRLCNGYGPTETCFCTFSRTLESSSSPANIGYGYGCNTWIVDESGTGLAPLGTRGELFIEGPIVAQGYLGDPEKTKQLFIEKPTWLPSRWTGAGKTSIAYNTGDMARYNPDGSIECLGRKDTQIKIRGMRTDLGEIENAVSSLGHKAVVLFPTEGVAAGNITAVVALGRSGGSGSLDILPEPESDSEEIAQLLALRRHISSKIPSYMHPTVWIPTGSLPMLTSAKISRLAVKNFVNRDIQKERLDSWSRVLSAVDHKSHILQPTESMAIELAGMVNKLTRTRDCPSDQPYHDIIISRAGIDSVKSIQLIRLIAERYGVTLPVGQIAGCEMSIRELVQQVQNLLTHPGAGGEATLPGINLAEEYRSISAMLQEYSHHSTRATRPSQVSDSVSTVFVTGAAGYLGFEILHQLLGRPNIRKVVALIRASSIEKALTRLELAADCMGWSLAPYLPKLEIWLGDLSKPQLGLSAVHWDQLQGNCPPCELIDAIIHVGATVNWTKSYNQLKSVNVSSTLSLLNASTQSLLRTGVRPRFIQISGGRLPASSLASSSWEAEGLELARALSAPGTLGYTQSKFLSDLLVCKWASLHGGTHDASVRVVMPGFIIGGGLQAVPNMDDVLWRLVSTNIALGIHSSNLQDRWVYVASTAVVSRKVMGCLFAASSGKSKSLNYEASAMAIPVSEGMSEATFWSLISNSGYPLVSTSHERWLAAVDADVEARGEKHPLYPVLHFVKQGVGVGGDMPTEVSDVYKHQEARVEAERDVVANLAYMRKKGFLPALRDSVSQVEGSSLVFPPPFISKLVGASRRHAYQPIHYEV